MLTNFAGEMNVIGMASSVSGPKDASTPEEQDHPFLRGTEAVRHISQ